jgi:hypothetical protein
MLITFGLHVADAEHQNVIRHRSSRSLRSGDSSQLVQSVQPAIFGTENSSVITASSGSTTILPCTVKKFGNGVVSLQITSLHFH